MCFGAVSSISCILIGIVASRHIKRFAFIVAGATFNVGLLIVLWLWKPTLDDVPNFFVVAGCLGLCDAIWQTQTYSRFIERVSYLSYMLRSIMTWSLKDSYKIVLFPISCTVFVSAFAYYANTETIYCKCRCKKTKSDVKKKLEFSELKWWYLFCFKWNR